MTETSHRTQNYKIDHSTFGGIIYSTDYCTNYPRHSSSRSMASRIVSDQKFDEQCRRNVKAKEIDKEYKEKNQTKEHKQNKENK